MTTYQMAARIRNTVLASLLLVLMTAACDSPTAEQYFDRAHENVVAGESEKAILDYTKAIRLDPQFVDAYLYRGNLFYWLGLNERAIQNWSEVIRLDPQIAMPYNNRGRAYEELGQQAKADADKKKACELDSKYC